MTMVRAAGSILIALSLAGCAGGSSLGGSAAPDTGMAGRWILAAPHAPVCGMNFAGAPGARGGTVSPEGGCPEKFFMSRRWALDQGALVINDENNQPLAKLSNAGGRFEGQSTAGTPVTLTRPTPPPG
ncbi:MAG: AprI/Inh family metalloprotease inhibitor [Rhizobiales bacterium]|nr:AprI/Inh family metalloprotease inhibitor [Hyphomicrobiales bacterium]